MKKKINPNDLKLEIKHIAVLGGESSQPEHTRADKCTLGDECYHTQANPAACNLTKNCAKTIEGCGGAGTLKCATNTRAELCCALTNDPAMCVLDTNNCPETSPCPTYPCPIETNDTACVGTYNCADTEGCLQPTETVTC